MDGLAQGIGLFVTEHMRGRGAGLWIAVFLPLAVAIYIPMFMNGRKQAAQDESLRPKPRAPLPRSFEGDHGPRRKA